MCTETLHRVLLHRSCQDTLHSNLSYGDLAKRPPICRDPVQEINLSQRSCQDVYYRDLAYRDFVKRSLTKPTEKIWTKESCTSFLHRTFYRYPCEGILCSSYRDPVREILHTIFYSSQKNLAEATWASIQKLATPPTVPTWHNSRTFHLTPKQLTPCTCLPPIIPMPMGDHGGDAAFELWTCRRGRFIPNQFAGGVSCRADVMAHAAPNWIHQNWQRSNNQQRILFWKRLLAFNERLPYEFLWDAQQHAPAFARFAAYCDGSPTNLVDQGQLNVVIWTAGLPTGTIFLLENSGGCQCISQTSKCHHVNAVISLHSDSSYPSLQHLPRTIMMSVEFHSCKSWRGSCSSTSLQLMMKHE